MSLPAEPIGPASDEDPPGIFSGLLSDTTWSAISDALAVIAALVSVVLITEALGDEGYGAFGALYGLATIFSAITYSGPGLALIQRRFRFDDSLDSLIRSYLSLALLAASVSTVLAVGLALLLNPLSVAEIVVVVASELFANSLIWVAGWLVQAAAGFAAMIRVRIVATLLKLVAVPLLFVTGSLTIFNLGLAYLVLYGAWAAWLILVRLPGLGYPRAFFRRPNREVLASSGIFALPLAASQIQTEGDKVVLGATNQLADAGVYGLAFRIVLLGALPVRVIQGAAFHRFLPEGDGEQGYHLARVFRFTGLMFAVGALATLGLYMVLYVPLFDPIVNILIRDDFEETRRILPWLAFFIPLQALSSTPTNGLLGLGRATERAYVFLSSSFVSLVLYLLFIPNYGWEGAVGATLAGEIYLLVASWAAMIYYQRKADRAADSGGQRVEGAEVDSSDDDHSTVL
jgi:O-antigen/teichoic acid export membrane protein